MLDYLIQHQEQLDKTFWDRALVIESIPCEIDPDTIDDLYYIGRGWYPDTEEE